MPAPSEAVRLAKRIASALLVALVSGAAMAQAELPTTGLRVLSAGSVRAALTDVVRAFEAQRPGSSVTLDFGASGLLKDRLLGGERAERDHDQAADELDRDVVVADASEDPHRRDEQRRRDQEGNGEPERVDGKE